MMIKKLKLIGPKLCLFGVLVVVGGCQTGVTREKSGLSFDNYNIGLTGISSAERGRWHYRLAAVGKTLLLGIGCSPFAEEQFEFEWLNQSISFRVNEHRMFNSSMGDYSATLADNYLEIVPGGACGYVNFDFTETLTVALGRQAKTGARLAAVEAERKRKAVLLKQEAAAKKTAELAEWVGTLKGEDKDVCGFESQPIKAIVKGTNLTIITRDYDSDVTLKGEIGSKGEVEFSGKSREWQYMNTYKGFVSDTTAEIEGQFDENKFNGSIVSRYQSGCYSNFTMKRKIDPTQIVAKKKEQERLAAEQARKIEEANAEEKRQAEQARERVASQKRDRALATRQEKYIDAIAVVIGNRKYANRVPAVEFAHNDASAMRKYLIGLGYREGNIIFITDATQAQLMAVFGTKESYRGKLFSYVRPGESDVTVFYSGHGVPGLKDRRGYLLPVNADPNLVELNGYPIDLLYSNLGKIPAKSIQVYMDACFSGDSPNGMLVRAASGLSITPKMPKKRAGSTMISITAAQGDQFASWDEDAKHGLFTQHLLEALNGTADKSRYGNGDGKVTLGEVKKYLDREMTYQARRRYNRDQMATVFGDRKLVLSQYR